MYESLAKIRNGVCVLGLMVSMSPSYGIEMPKKYQEECLSEDYGVRKSAEKKVYEWVGSVGEEALIAVLKLSLGGDEPELRQRCLSVLRKISDDEYMKEGEGYVGVMMLDQLVKLEGKAKPQAVIQVGAVVQGSPADQAGIQMHDQIISLDGVEWVDVVASMSFGDMIRKMPPGRVIRLKILRNGQVMEKPVKLGKRLQSANFRGLNDIKKLEEMERAERDVFFGKWLAEKYQQHGLKK